MPKRESSSGFTLQIDLTDISMATVMGPTPPGTGVMKPACSLAEA